MTPDRVALLRLARAEGVGPVGFRRLLARHGDAHAALAALPPGRAVPDPGTLQREAEALHRMGGRFLLLDEPDYPEALAATDDAPPVLAVLGRVSLLGARAVAIVGARNASTNGCRFAETLASELALAGVVVVSGFARGIDTASHEGAAGLGMTVAVLAGGLDRPYPPENRVLGERILAAGGAIVSEMPLGTVPTQRHFPRRNRIVAGLALGCVVVEAAAQSGSLLTARMALDRGRELWAVPGSPFDPRARGANDLLRQGAHLCTSGDDVLAHLPPGPPAPAALRRRAAPDRPPDRSPDRSPGAAPRPPPLSPSPSPPERAADDPGPPAASHHHVLALLGPAPTAIDELIRRCQLSASLVVAALAELELDGKVELLPGSRVCRLAG